MIKEYILCAAIHFQDGEKHEHQPKNIENGYVICGRRHHNCFATRYVFKGIDKRSGANYINNIQGFLTNTDRFVTREEAYMIAIESGQLKENPVLGTKLFSEDLW